MDKFVDSGPSARAKGIITVRYGFHFGNDSIRPLEDHIEGIAVLLLHLHHLGAVQNQRATDLTDHHM